MHNKLPEDLKNEILKEMDAFFSSDQYRSLWEMYSPKKLTIIQRIVAFVKNNG
jgi:hypothetical protein